MKKFFAVFICTVLCVTVLAACSSAPISAVTRSGFLKKNDVKTVSYVSEHCEYGVSYIEAEKPVVSAKYSLAAANSYLKTDLTVVESDGSFGEAGKDYYLFATETHIEGSYEIDGEKTDCVNDISSKVYFLGVGDDLRPVYSEKTVNAQSLESLNGKLSVKKYVYSISTKYDGKKAIVTFTPDKENSTGTFSLDGGYEMDKVSDGNYFDNEQLLFAPRAMDLKSGFSTTFKSLDAVSKSLNTMSFAYATGDNAVTQYSFDKGAYVVTDNEFNTSSVVEKCKVNTINLSIASTYSGATQRLSFAASDEVGQYCRLIHMVVPATYGTGEFVFHIRNAAFSFAK